jgi:hypothetical protein
MIQTGSGLLLRRPFLKAFSLITWMCRQNITGEGLRQSWGQGLQRQEHYSINPLMQLATPSNELKIGYALAHRDVELMGINDTGKLFSGLLTPVDLAQQIFILSEEQST